jgi:hypothetical protein
MTPSQRARVFRRLCLKVGEVHCELTWDLQMTHAPDEAYGLVTRRMQQYLTSCALRLNLTKQEWDQAMDLAVAREVARSPLIDEDGGITPDAHYAWAFGVDAVEMADAIRNDPHKQLQTRLKLFKQDKREFFGEDAAGVPLAALMNRRALQQATEELLAQVGAR